MEHRNKIVIQARGKSWLIFLIKYMIDGNGGWKPAEELIRGPVSWRKGYVQEETEFQAKGLAEQEKVRRGIFEPVEVRE